MSDSELPYPWSSRYQHVGCVRRTMYREQSVLRLICGRSSLGRTDLDGITHTAKKDVDFVAACLCACVWLGSIVPMCFKTTAVIATGGGHCVLSRRPFIVLLWADL